MFLKRYKIRSYEMGLYFRDREFRGVLDVGTHWIPDLLGRVRVDVVSRRDPWLMHEKLDLIVKSGALRDRAVVLDLKDHQRGLVWIEGRFSHILMPGLYAYWAGQRDVHVEVADSRQVRFEHADLKFIARSRTAAVALDIRSQANTAKLLQDSPTLMRLRELEVLERIALAGKLNVVLGEKGLADRVVNLL